MEGTDKGQTGGKRQQELQREQKAQESQREREGQMEQDRQEQQWEQDKLEQIRERQQQMEQSNQKQKREQEQQMEQSNQKRQIEQEQQMQRSNQKRQIEQEEQMESSRREQQKEQQQKEEYQQYVKEMTPTHNLWLQMLKAFIAGGIICCIGQFILNYAGSLGLDKQTAGSWCSLILVLLSVILTGFGIYPKIVKWGGAGALVPITGFANSVAAPAIEYKAEGQVFGIGCKIFTIAGPVILYGIFSSWVLGVIYWLGKCFGVW